MIKLINEYINTQLAWSDTTRKSELSRLLSVSNSIDGTPENLWHAIETKKPYTKVIIFTRVAAFWTWLIQHNHRSGPNFYISWRKQNSRLFKNAYVKERLNVTYEEARTRIDSITDAAIRKRCLEILYGAVRYKESITPVAEGIIVGKGGKLRPDFRPELPGPSYDGSYSTIYRTLKKLGLKPHTLRKLALTRLVDKGASAYDLMEVAGWSSPITAASYIQPKAVSKLKKMLKD